MDKMNGKMKRYIESNNKFTFQKRKISNLGNKENGNTNGNGNFKRHKPNSNTQNGNGIVPKKFNLQEQRKKMPIFYKRNEIIDTIRKNDSLIILSETGSGKTTQIPQFIYSAKLNNNGKIAVTQPRRVAAISVAMRVAKEMGVDNPMGGIVGYAVRFDDVTSPKTKIKFATDGTLLREAMSDNLLMDYTIIILDEAHERTIHTDVLFGIVKQAQSLRKEKNLTPLKIILMSATMDVDHFSKYFNNCQVLYLEGRTYPVNIFYSLKPHEDYASACVATFFQIHQEAPDNEDVLIFLTGQEEIETVAHQIRVLARDPDVSGPPVKVCTLYAAQPTTTQMSVFLPAPKNTRKVIISTNIAETSVTISGIRYVIDCGMVKLRTFHPSTGLDVLKVQKISQEQTLQRAGRAGRECEGNCYRIYTRAEYESMSKTTIPEIQRANVTTVVIQLLSLGVHALTFDFMDKPPKPSIVAAFEQLKLLGAIDSVESSSLTKIGKRMAQFPLDPRFSRIILASQKYGCVEEILTIVALLSGESIYLNPPSKRLQVLEAREKFKSPDGDLITLLNVYRNFKRLKETHHRQWCQENFINIRNINYAGQVRDQLLEICEKYHIELLSCKNETENIRKCLIKGLFMNVAQLNNNNKYVMIDTRQVVYVHPSSVLHFERPECVLFTEVVQTTKCYLRNLTTIDIKWLEEIIPEYTKSRCIINRTKNIK